MPDFHYYTNIEIKTLTNSRDGEIKIGDKLALASNLSQISNKLVIIGIAEDIGVKANMGKVGTKHAFESFLPFFSKYAIQPICRKKF